MCLDMLPGMEGFGGGEMNEISLDLEPKMEDDSKPSPNFG